MEWIVALVSHGCGAPNVSECEGEYQYEARKNQLTWQLPVVDSSNKSGAMEFSCQGQAEDFFPINVSFYSKRPYADLSVTQFLSFPLGYVMFLTRTQHRASRVPWAGAARWCLARNLPFS